MDMSISPPGGSTPRHFARLFHLSCGLAVLFLSALAGPAHAWDQWASEVIDFSTQYSATGYSAAQVLDLPNVFNYGDNGGGWAPESKNGTQEFITVGFPDPVYANGVTIRENVGNGFVTKVEVLDTNGAYHQVWSGTDPSQPGEVVDFKVTFSQTAYLVRGVRVSTNTSHDPNAWEEIDAIRLHGQAPGDYQWASRVVGFSSEYHPSPESYSSSQALGEPNVPEYGDDERAWTSVNRDGTVEYLTVGFTRPVFATGVGIRETSGSGFVTKIEALDINGVYHQVWSGTDPTQPGFPRLFRVTWPQTVYAVDGLKITVNTNHSPSNWEEIDAVYIMGASATSPAPVATSLSPTSRFREAPAFTLTVNGSNFLATSVVRWNGADRATQYVSPSQLTATIPASDLAAPGTAQVTVFTPPPGGGTSNALPFTISTTLGQWASAVLAVTSEWHDEGDFSAERALGAPDVPDYGDDGNAWTPRGQDISLQSITLLYPRSVFANGAMVRETVGNGFVRKIEALDTEGAFHQVWAGTDTSQPGQIAEFQVSFPQTAYAVRGLRITIDTNHAMNQWEEIDAVQLQGVPVTYPAPTITKLGPNPALRNGPPMTLVVTGTGFAPNSVVKWNGADRATTFVSPTTLTIRVPAADTAGTGTASITVFTPAPGGGTSAATALNIGPARYGDVDGNNQTDITDVRLALRRAAGLEKATVLNGGDVAPEYPVSSDGYGDGRINISDAVRIARFLQSL